MALRNGRGSAEFWGGLKEFLSSGDALDSARDRYNNEVGRRMADWIQLNEYDESTIDRLMLDALRSVPPRLVIDLNDPRITSQPPAEPDWTGLPKCTAHGLRKATMRRSLSSKCPTGA